MTAHRLGYLSSLAILIVGAAYTVVLGLGICRYGLEEPIRDPILAAMEVLTLLSAPPVLTLMAAVHALAEPRRSAVAMAALAFATLFAGATSAVHFVELTATRQLGGAGLVWPSTAYAVELLAWDVLLGLAALFAAAAFEPTPATRGVRYGLQTCGWLCVLGTVGPVVGNMRLQLVGVFGYAVVFPVTAALLARHFAATRASTPS